MNEQQQQTDSLEAQLASLYAEREQLERHLGVSEAQQIIDLVRTLEGRPNHDAADAETNPASAGADPATSLELQLIDLYQERDRLQSQLGTADSDELCALVGNLEAQLRDLYQERERGVAAAARVAAQIRGIASELGGNDAPSELVFEAAADASSWRVAWRPN